MEETKIIYHIDDEDTPYLIKLPIAPDKVTLGDFKNALNRPNYKFFFKSMDDDFGVVKEEIIDDNMHLPCFNGRVVSWLVPADNSTSDSQSVTDSVPGDLPKLPSERLGGIGDSRPPSFHANASTRDFDNTNCDTCTETESVLSSRRDGPVHRAPPHRPLRDRHHDGRYSRHPHPHNSTSRYSHEYNHQQFHPHHPMHQVVRMNGHGKHRDRAHGFDATSSVMSSDIETTSFFDSEDDASSRFSTATETTARSSKLYGRHRRRRRRHRMPPISRASSFSSITDSTMSLNIITVTLNMDTVNFLGISIVGQSNKGGDGGIYVGSIMKGGAVAQDGRVEPGDMILEVNGVSFENMSNDDAVRTLREAVQKPGPITLVVAKCWDPNPKGYFTIPRQEPVRPIDPSAWVAHTNAMSRVDYGRGPMSPSLSTVTSTTSSLSSSLADTERYDMNLTVNTDMATIVRAMAQPDSGLEIRDRMWLKITIPNAFIGSDLVDWLHTHVEGFADRRDARKYACNLLKAGYIRHTVNKLSFSEQCYYVFGDICGVPGVVPFDPSIFGSGSNLLPNLSTNLSSLTLDDIDSVSEIDRDTVPPLPPPNWTTGGYNPYGPTPYLPPPPAMPINYNVPPKPHGFLNDSASYVSMPAGNGSAGSVHSGSAKRDKSCACIVSHTYKQLRKLWEVPKDKHMAVCPVHNGPPVTFDDDINRSTSSSADYETPNGLSSMRTDMGTHMALHRSKDKLLASHHKLNFSSTDTLEHSSLNSTEKTLSKSHNCLSMKTPNLKNLVVNQQVCMDLCLPFWRCRPLSKTTSLPPQSSVGSPTSYSNSETKPPKMRVRMSRDSLVPASKDDIFCVKTPYPVRVHPDAMTLDSASLTSDLGTVSRSFSKSQLSSRSFSKSQLSSRSSGDLDADVISLDTSSCSDASFRYRRDFLARIADINLLTLDDHINQALGVSYALKKGSSASSSSQRNKQNKDPKSGMGLGQSDRKPGTPPGIPDQDKGLILPTDRGELPPPPRALSDANPDLGGSKQSFRMAMGNPYSDETLTDMGDL